MFYTDGNVLTFGPQGGCAIRDPRSGKVVHEGAFPSHIYQTHQARLVGADGSVYGCDKDYKKIFQYKPGAKQATEVFGNRYNRAALGATFGRIALMHCDTNYLYALVGSRLCKIALREPFEWSIISDTKVLRPFEFGIVGDPERMNISSEYGVHQVEFGIASLVKVDNPYPMIGIWSPDGKWHVGYRRRGEHQPHNIELLSAGGETRKSYAWREEEICEIDLHWETRAIARRFSLWFKDCNDSVIVKPSLGRWLFFSTEVSHGVRRGGNCWQTF